ncbi:hypothetical protein ElyMa_004098000 [Elysia marginata]|uniref:Uncharacterized protein n=1 Tax=Elysia marginata TaxID=1093978 RepID=A0AAV4GBF4_9GAST|nr:hypothetical protein ElyMa_004098000 [Elysia marginata]
METYSADEMKYFARHRAWRVRVRPEPLAHAAVTVLVLVLKTPLCRAPAAPSCPSTSTVQVKVRLPGPVGQQRKEENRRRNCVLRRDISRYVITGSIYDRRIDSTDDDFQRKGENC